ncbi:MAG: putative maltokinase, partial [Candidatus Acidiferrales bacterium]
GPYGFLWFELQKAQEPAEPAAAENAQFAGAVIMTSGWEGVFEGAGKNILERNLPAFLGKQRWFGGKSRRILSTEIIDWADIAKGHAALAILVVRYQDSGSEQYLLPLAASYGIAAGAIRSTSPLAILCPAISLEDNGSIHDAMLEDDLCKELLRCIGEQQHIPTSHGKIHGYRSAQFPELRGPADADLTPSRHSGEQSNSSILYGERLILKLFRKVEPGPNPDSEIGRYLTEKTDFRRIPPFAGSIEYVRDGEIPTTTALLQGLVANEGDGWKWFQGELARYYEEHAPVQFPADASLPAGTLIERAEHPANEFAREHLGLSLDSAGLLGRRTAEMHLALASPTSDPAFTPEPLGGDDCQELAQEFRLHAIRVLDLLKENLAALPDDFLEQGALLLSRRRDMLNAFQTLGASDAGGLKTRIHGDYHLGQVLLVKHDFVILDFEGEPARSLAERRAKRSPLKDVAGMLRSFSYAAHAATFAYLARHPDHGERLDPWTRLWEQTTTAEFLRAYRAAVADSAVVPPSADGFRRLLDAYLLDKALYELRYELDARPAWVKIPALGILSLLQ